MGKLPLIVQILQGIFGTQYIPESFEAMDNKKTEKAENEITKNCFAEVIPRFQNISEGLEVKSKMIFYEYDRQSIHVKPEAVMFFKENYPILSKAITLEWAKFLEKINIGLPMLISKIEGQQRQRGSLEKFKIILAKHFDRCFYCIYQLAQAC